MALYDLRYSTPLTPEEAAPETDMIPVFHATGGVNVERSLSLANLLAVAGGDGAAPAGGVSKAEFDAFKAAVVSDLNNLRDSIMLITASLDNDTGVATDTYAAMGDPPPITAGGTGAGSGA